MRDRGPAVGSFFNLLAAPSTTSAHETDYRPESVDRIASRAGAPNNLWVAVSRCNRLIIGESRAAALAGRSPTLAVVASSAKEVIYFGSRFRGRAGLLGLPNARIAKGRTEVNDAVSEKRNSSVSPPWPATTIPLHIDPELRLAPAFQPTVVTALMAACGA